MVKIEVQLEDALAKKIKNMAKERRFKSESDFIAYILKEVVSKLEKGAAPAVSQEEKKESTKILKKMGYL